MLKQKGWGYRLVACVLFVGVTGCAWQGHVMGGPKPGKCTDPADYVVSVKVLNRNIVFAPPTGDVTLKKGQVVRFAGDYPLELLLELESKGPDSDPGEISRNWSDKGECLFYTARKGPYTLKYSVKMNGAQRDPRIIVN